MSFNALCLTHAPDADSRKHRSRIETGKYRLFSVVVKTQAEALEVVKELYREENIHAVMLCPGFTHRDAAELFEALEGRVSVSVSRGDGPSQRVIQPILEREFFSGG